MTTTRTSTLHHGTELAVSGGVGRIRSIGYRHAEAVGELLATAFHHEPVTRWLAPDVEARPDTMARFFTAMATSAFTTGSVDVLLDRQDIPIAAAVWFDHLTPHPHDDAGSDGDELGGAPESGAFGLTRKAVDASSDPWTLLDQAMTAAHPTRPHEYLMLIGVHPAYQGQGLGTRLLTHHHAWLDATGTAAYLEATSPESRALYTRLGYDDHAAPLHPAGLASPGGAAGPTLWPMWRQPRSAPASVADRSLPQPAHDGNGGPVLSAGPQTGRVLRWVT